MSYCGGKEGAPRACQLCEALSKPYIGLADGSTDNIECPFCELSIETVNHTRLIISLKHACPLLCFNGMLLQDPAERCGESYRIRGGEMCRVQYCNALPAPEHALEAISQECTSEQSTYSTHSKILGALILENCEQK